MKKPFFVYLLSSILILFNYQGYSQTSPIGKKSLTIGASGGYWSHKGELYEDADGNKATTGSLDLNIGYFVLPHLALGFKVDNRVDKQGEMKLVNRGIGPYCSYYFGRLDKEEVPGSFYPYITLAYMWKKKTQEFMYQDYFYEDSKKIRSVSIQVGGLFMIANSVGIYGKIGYEFDKGDYKWSWEHPNATVPDGFENDQKGGVFTMGIGIRLFIYEKSFE